VFTARSNAAKTTSPNSTFIRFDCMVTRCSYSDYEQ
jgi:hypothetical protein